MVARVGERGKEVRYRRKSVRILYGKGRREETGREETGREETGREETGREAVRYD